MNNIGNNNQCNLNSLARVNATKNEVEKYTLKKICKVFGVSRDAYIKWKNQIISPTQSQTNLLNEEITSIFIS